MSLFAAILLANTATAVACGWLAPWLVPGSWPRPGRREAVSLTLLAACLPGLGPPLVLLAGALLPRISQRRRPQTPRGIAPPPFAPEIPVRAARFGAGGAAARLRAPGAHSTESIRALRAVQSHRDAGDVSLLRDVLRSDDETLRLLAHATLDRRETNIHRLMTQTREALEQAEEARRRAWLQRELAALHMELIYQGLSRASLSRHHQEEAQRHLAACAGELGDDPRYLVLCARLAVLRNASETTVNEALERAHRHHIAASRIIPYQAEQAWRSGRYSEVRRLLASEPLLTLLPKIGPVARYWRRGADS